MKLNEETWTRWRCWIERIREDVEVVVNDGVIFREFRSIVEANGTWIDENDGWLWTDFSKRSYAAATFVAIRRQLKNNKDSISLRQLLEQMKECSDQLSYDFYLEVHPIRGDGEFPWQRSTFNTLSDDERVVSRGQVESDLKKLHSLNKHIEEVADREVAHLDKRGTDAVVTFDDLAASVQQLDELTCRYFLFLTGEQYGSLEAAIPADWSRGLRQALTRPT